ncbi:LacI family DNA-binding transcriptional regulator [Pontivivens insulae]|uniref:Catabolite control protein A n=1 Tax=Pontivivens insulae TaxID=1639689 RepID=A0A2R8A7S7_9RHOB|nr:LacI family DNA-binding transcriptional regulator [Pontivivens insulae]RED18385.1 LacI family transcriptional regulator [Pontivivens insulae]SPF28283.1 Catabolite control protein A [Pontivivens insulae]
MSKNPTIADVAREAGVSTATVSRTLNDPDRVKEPTRVAVQDAVNKLGYTPHFGGRILASNRTNTVGAVIPTMENAVFAHGLQTLQASLADMGITLLVATSSYDREHEEHQIRTLLARGVDGLALIGAERSAEIYALLDRREVPYVLMWTGGKADGHFTVGFDNDAAARQVVDKVVAAGHTKIAMIAGTTEGNDRAAERVAGVRAALAERGLPAPTIVEVPYQIEEGERAAAAFLSAAERPTVLICGNDVLAAGALRAARTHGVNVPDQISIVGFDDIDLARVVEPPLTTVRVPHRRMGTSAAQHLVEWMRTGVKPASILYRTDFIERASLGRPPK